MKVYQLSIILLVLVSVKSDDKCRILVLEGGGDRGAYHAGAFHELVNNLPSEEVAYDIVTGISVGALNGLALSFFEKGDEKNASKFLDQVWDTIQSKDVYTTWPWYIFAPTKEKGLFDTTPLRKYLTNMASSHEVKRQFSVGVSNILDQSYERYINQDVPTVEDKVNMLMSSSAIPGLFPFINWKEKVYVDGGMMKNFDVIGGVHYCLNKGYQQDQIIVDSILCYGKKHNISSGDVYNTVTNVAAMIDMELQRFFLADLKDSQQLYPLVNYRYLITPPVWMAGDLFINFNRAQMKLMYANGQKDVQDAIKKTNKDNYIEGNFHLKVQELTLQRQQQFAM